MKRHIQILCALLVATLTVAAGARDSTTEAAIPDDRITDAVEHQLLIDPAVNTNHIDIRVADGVADLAGTVDNLLAKERATKVAETVRGIRAVVNRISVEPSALRADAEILDDVQQALFDDPATDSYEIDAAVADGWVTLTGKVDSWPEKRLCAVVASGVRGVVGLHNEIQVDHDGERADHEIEPDIERMLDNHALVDSSLIEVSVDDGHVALSGVVGSAAEKRIARRQAWTAGVRSVDSSGLTVEYSARDADLGNHRFVERSDDEIRDAVEDALIHDPRVFSFNVDPSVHNGRVTLRGHLDNLKAKRAAVEDARNTVGVRSVRNLMKVRPTTIPSDDEIETGVERALMREPYVNRFGIEVEVENGVAYLSGDLDSHFEKARADDATSRVNGVIAVVNDLAVQDPRPISSDPWIYDWSLYDYDWYHFRPTFSHIDDWQIRQDIESELWWSPFVDSDEVTVSVEDSVATLTGTVDSWLERDTARENAYEGGATYVRNRLEVD